MYSVTGLSVLNFLSHFSLALSGPGQRSVKADLSEQLVYEYKLSTDPTFSAKRTRLVALNLRNGDNSGTHVKGSVSRDFRLPFFKPIWAPDKQNVTW